MRRTPRVIRSMRNCRAIGLAVALVIAAPAALRAAEPESPKPEVDRTDLAAAYLRL